MLMTESTVSNTQRNANGIKIIYNGQKSSISECYQIFSRGQASVSPLDYLLKQFIMSLSVRHNNQHIMNKYNRALSANQTQAHSLDVNQHAPQHIRLAWIENFLYDRKKTNGYKGWTTLPMLVEAMKQTSANVLRLVRILEKQGRVDVELDGRNGDGSGYQCLWIRPIKSNKRHTISF